MSVTPFVGVWIETDVTLLNRLSDLSHPSWVCGLKLCINIHLLSNHLSHPSWVCGLKQYLSIKILPKLSHTLRGCVD